MCLRAKRLFVCLLMVCSQWASAAVATDIYNRAGDTVYLVGQRVDQMTGKGEKKPSQGSAVAVSPRYLASNCHVFKNSDRGVILIDPVHPKGQYLKVAFRDAVRDLCILEVEGAKFAPAKLRDSKTVLVGEVVYAIGNPKGNQKTLSKGIISKVVRSPHTNEVEYFLTDNVIAPGSSGGGLFDSEGDLIGITKGVLKDKRIGSTYAYVIAADRVAEKLGLETVVVDPNSLARRAVRQVDTLMLGLIGQFGRGQVRLIKQDDECYITIKGRDSKNNIVSNALFRVNRGNAIYLTRGATDEFSTVAMYLKVQSANNISPVRTKDMFTLGEDSVLLQGLIGDGDMHHFSRAFVLNDPVGRMSHAAEFRVDFNDGFIFKTRVHYSLEGFAEALAKARHSCTIGD